MREPRTRREFLADVGRGALVASVGVGLAKDLWLSSALAEEVAAPLTFGPLEPLVVLMQETPADALLGVLVERLRSGTDLRTLVAAGALANARTFGGEDYVGFHTMMALAPAFRMAGELPEALAPLPVLKVLHRNTARIQAFGGRKSEVLRSVEPAADAGAKVADEAVAEAVRAKDVPAAERALAAVVRGSPDEALQHVLTAVEDATEVHRVVLPYRAWELLDILGKEHALTMLRQSVRYCVQENRRIAVGSSMSVRAMLPGVLERHHLLEGARPREGARLLEGVRGRLEADDAWVAATSQAILEGSPAEAAELVAAALEKGIDPAAVGEAISLAANQLVLRDAGRPPDQARPGKPAGSVHGDSIGVHASDSASAWRGLSLVGNARNRSACLVLGAYQVALDRTNRGGDFLHWSPHPLAEEAAKVATTEPDALLREADAAIREKDQLRACAVVERYGRLGHPARPVFDLLLGYATSEDGALHAEKYYLTVCEEFAATRPAFRWRHLVALARVTASEYGQRAEGYDESRRLLKV